MMRNSYLDDNGVDFDKIVDVEYTQYGLLEHDTTWSSEEIRGGDELGVKCIETGDFILGGTDLLIKYEDDSEDFFEEDFDLIGE